MRRIFAFIIAAAVLISPPLLRAETAEGPEPEVEVTAPRSYYAKRAALFPLELPVYAFKAALWPLTEGVGYLERRHVFERGADLLSNKEKTFWVYPVIDWGAGSHFGGGAGITHTDLFNDKYLLNAEYAINIALNQRFRASLAKDDLLDLWGRPLSFQTAFQWNRTLDADYYGRGGGSRRDDRSRYSIDDIDLDGRFTYELGWKLSLQGRAGLATADTGPSTRGGYPSVDTTFGAQNLPGFDRWLTFLRFGIGIAHDDRDNARRPGSGGRREFLFLRHQCVNSESFSSNEYVFDFRHYFTLWKPGLIFAIRNNWSFQQNTGSAGVPFYRLELLDYRSPLRGFKRGRFRDKSSVLLNFDYMFPLSSVMGGALFVDTGRVFDGIGSFSFDDWRYSAGGSVDMRLFRVTIFKFTAAYGGEGVNLMLSLRWDI